MPAQTAAIASALLKRNMTSSLMGSWPNDQRDLACHITGATRRLPRREKHLLYGPDVAHTAAHSDGDGLLDVVSPAFAGHSVDHHRRISFVAPFIEHAQGGNVGHHVVGIRADPRVGSILVLEPQRVIDDDLAAERDPQLLAPQL